MTWLKPQASKWWIQGSNLANWLQSIAYNQSKPVPLEVGCLEEQCQPGNLLEVQIPESRNSGGGTGRLCLSTFELV